jgi:hypothetical protein
MKSHWEQNMRDDYMTTGDVAKLHKVTNQAIDSAVKMGQLEVACKTVGGFRLFRREDVERFAASKTKKRAAKARLKSALRNDMNPSLKQDRG